MIMASQLSRFPVGASAALLHLDLPLHGDEDHAPDLYKARLSPA